MRAISPGGINIVERWGSHGTQKGGEVMMPREYHESAASCAHYIAMSNVKKTSLQQLLGCFQHVSTCSPQHVEVSQICWSDWNYDVSMDQC
jgi:hypothetical protein